MTRDALEWLGAMLVVVGAGMAYLPLGFLAAGLWLLWAANADAIAVLMFGTGGEDGTDAE